MALFQISLSSIAIILLLGHADAHFQIRCSKLLESRIDPIRSPGTVSGSVNTFVGASNVGQSSTYSSLLNAPCTTCEVSKDKSSYWTPQLYWQSSDGTFNMVPSNGSTVSYYGVGSLYTGVIQFSPPGAGFKVIAGNPYARSYDQSTLTFARLDHAANPIADRVSWTCFTGSGEVETPGFPQTTNCPGGLRARIRFPSCWNGVDTYKSDNSHVAYLSSVSFGGCPPGFTKLLPHLVIDTFYSLTGSMSSSSGRLVLSTGDTTGYGYYGGFMNGWDSGVFQSAVTNCLFDVVSGGTIGECSALQSNFVANTASLCPHKDSPVNEQVSGTLKALPGCNKITSGPANAVLSDMTCAAGVSIPNIGLPFGSSSTSSARSSASSSATSASTSSSRSTSTQSSSTRSSTSSGSVSTLTVTVMPEIGKQFGRLNWNYVGCSPDTAGVPVLNTTSYNDTSGLTIEACQTYCQSKGQKYAGVKNGYQCSCGNFVNPAVSNFNTANVCNTRCFGDPTRTCGGSATIQIFNNTAAQVPPQPSVLPKSGTYISKGCYKEAASDGIGERTLGDASTWAATLTVDSCVRFCLGQNLRFAGVESGNQCYCATNLNLLAQQAPASDCNLYCAGSNNKTAQMCGGGARLNVYYSKNVIPVSRRWRGRRWMPWIGDEGEG